MTWPWLINVKLVNILHQHSLYLQPLQNHLPLAVATASSLSLLHVVQTSFQSLFFNMFKEHISLARSPSIYRSPTKPHCHQCHRGSISDDPGTGCWQPNASPRFKHLMCCCMLLIFVACTQRLHMFRFETRGWVKDWKQVCFQKHHWHVECTECMHMVQRRTEGPVSP